MGEIGSGTHELLLSKTEQVPKLLWGLVQPSPCLPQHGGFVLSVLSLWEVWGLVHRARRKGILWWNSACCNDMQTIRIVGGYPSPVSPFVGGFCQHVGQSTIKSFDQPVCWDDMRWC